MKKKRIFNLVVLDIMSVENYIRFLVYIALLSICLFTYYAFMAKSNIRYLELMCVSDYLKSLAVNFIPKLLLIPTSSFFVVYLVEHHQTSNRTIRFIKKRRLVAVSMLKSIILSFLLSIVITLIAFLMSGLFTSETNNWNSQRSYFFISNGYTASASIIQVVLWNILVFYEEILFLVALILFLSIFLSKKIAYIIVSALYVSNLINIITYSIGLHLESLGFQNQYPTISSKILYFAILPVMIVSIFVFAVFMCKRKDYLV